jgi:hypothetical protein
MMAPLVCRLCFSMTAKRIEVMLKHNLLSTRRAKLEVID